jgi:hypothetical protein
MHPLPTRREAIRFGLGMGSILTLPNLLRLRAASDPTPGASDDTAAIFIQLGGGASHHETFDPKPDAPAEYRGPFGSVPTSLPGVRFSDSMPKLAGLMKHLAIVRSVRHNEASHIALHVVESGYFLRNAGNARTGEMPAIGSVVARVRGCSSGLPAFVSLPRPQAYSGPAHLGGRYGYFPIDGDPSAPDFRIANLALARGLTDATLTDRQSLLRDLDDRQRQAALPGQAEAIDGFQRQALDLITGDLARTAFDLGREPEALRERYGRNAFGQRLLLARRLVEAGIPFVAVRTFDWDDHQDLAKRMRGRCPEFDHCLATLLTDLLDRGLDRRVLVIAMGEFGRTPKVNGMGGRDHWPGVMSVLLAGRYRMGQVIGASDGHGATVLRAPYLPQQVLGMVYRHLNIDPALTFPDHTGRPRHVLEEREPVEELG